MVKFNPTEGCGEFLPGYGYPHDFTPPVSVGAPDPGDPPSPVVVYCGFQNVYDEQIPNNPLITTRTNQLGSEVTVITFPLGKTIVISEQFLDANPAIESSLDANPVVAYIKDPNYSGAYDKIAEEVFNIVFSNEINPEQIKLNFPQGFGNYGIQANTCGTITIELIPPPTVVNPVPTVELSGPDQEPIPPNPEGGYSAKFTVDIDPADLPEWELVPNNEEPPIVITPPDGNYEEDIEVDVNFGPVEKDTQVSVVAVGKDNEGNIEVSSNTVTVTLDHVELEPGVSITANPNPVAVNENTDIEVTIVSEEVNQFEIDYGDGQSDTQFVDGDSVYTLAKTYNTTGTNTITVNAKAVVEGVLETVKTEFFNVDVSSAPAGTPSGTISYELNDVPFEVGSEVTFVTGSEPTFTATIVNGVDEGKYFWFLDNVPDIDQVNQDYTYKFIDEGTYTLDLKYVPSQSVFLDLDSVTITITLD